MSAIEPIPTREECLRAAAKVVLAEAIRIERERLEREAVEQEHHDA